MSDATIFHVDDYNDLTIMMIIITYNYQCDNEEDYQDDNVDDVDDSDREKKVIKIMKKEKKMSSSSRIR